MRASAIRRGIIERDSNSSKEKVEEVEDSEDLNKELDIVGIEALATRID